MRLLKVLKRESSLTLAREALWRAQREWNRKRTPARLRRTGEFQFCCVPYYAPAPQSISKRAQTLILSFADEIRSGRYPLLSYKTPELGRRPKWNRSEERRVGKRVDLGGGRSSNKKKRDVDVRLA